MKHCWQLTRTNEKITGEAIRLFIDSLDISDAVKEGDESRHSV